MNRSRIRTGASLLFVVTLLVVALLAASPTLAQTYAPTPGPGEIIVPVGDEGGSIETPSVIINVPAGATGGADYNFVYTPLESVSCAPPVGCQLFSTFDLSTYVGIDLVTPVTFDPPLEICFTYTGDQADAVGGIDNLAPVLWSDDESRWVPLDNVRYDETQMKICGDLVTLTNSACGIGLTCALSPSGVPVTGEEAPAGSSMAPIWLSLVAAVVLASGLGVLRKVKTD